MRIGLPAVVGTWIGAAPPMASSTGPGPWQRLGRLILVEHACAPPAGNWEAVPSGLQRFLGAAVHVCPECGKASMCLDPEGPR